MDRSGPHEYRGSPKREKPCKTCGGDGFIGELRCDCGSVPRSMFREQPSTTVKFGDK